MKQKEIYMKHLLFGICSSIILCLSSCGGTTEYIYHHFFTYRNESGHDLHIEQWNEGEKKVYDLAAHHEEMEFHLIFPYGGCFINDSSIIDNRYCMLYEGDSLKIIFDDGKTLIYRDHIDSSSFNPFIIENYTSSKDGNKEYYEYTFTEEDYNLAVGE